MRCLRIAVLSGLMMGGLGAAMAESDLPSSLEAHEHGHATLNIAIQGQRVDIELEAPGADIIGFEHGARTKEQVSALETGKEKLARLNSVVGLPAAAGCRVVEAQVEQHGAEASPGSDGLESGGQESDGKERQEAGHSEFHATYVLNCSEPGNLVELKFPYFNSFAGTEELEVNIVGSGGQKRFEVSRESPQISLLGIM